MTLAAFACDPLLTRGRRFAEVAAPTRSDFQRDRDRIVHSTAFRRLVYKTQVFLNHEGDLFRTRLTHSLEVAQIAKGIALICGANPELVHRFAEMMEERQAALDRAYDAAGHWNILGLGREPRVAKLGELGGNRTRAEVHAAERRLAVVTDAN